MITNMVSRESLQKIKKDVDGYIGQRICVKADSGRNKCEYKEGILTSTYSSTFNVVDENTARNMNYSYTDLLTNKVELTLPNGESIAGYDYSVICHSKF
ncbi:MAG: Veg family protein [Clostridia bacterium]|nr:Veg family protein [Clostridia bacterium]MDD4386191.1 Veg family protein [Clostridia bacterium]